VFAITIGDTGEVKLSGRFDAARADEAGRKFESITETCTIDMADLDYISSAGLGILLSVHKRLLDSGHRMTLKNMNPHIRRILQISGLDKVFAVAE
jgi:anti-sigma B factor antagonist